jgi:hypothetical protein
MINAKSRPENNYVVAGNDTIACKNLAFTVSNAEITLPNGDKTQINKDNVSAYSVKNKKFENRPVYVDGKPNGNFAYLELLGERGGLKLFKYSYYETAGWDKSKSINDMKKVNVYTVFKGDKYYVQMDMKNSKTLLHYFNLDEFAIE